MNTPFYENPRNKGIYHPKPGELIRAHLAKHHTAVVHVIGPPGSGKTQLIEATLKKLPAPGRVAVITVNPASSRDADRLYGLCGRVYHIDAAAPESQAVWRCISQLDPDYFDLILIESAGGLSKLPDLGQDATAAVLAVSGGDDKAAEYAELLRHAGAVVLTKLDLKPLVKFDLGVFRADIERINPAARLHEVSALTGGGMLSWQHWLNLVRVEKRRREVVSSPEEPHQESYIG